MLGNFGSLILSVLAIGIALALYMFRARLREFFASDKKEDEKEFRRLLEQRVQKLGVNWSSKWPSVLAVYEIMLQLSENQQDSSAALGNALKIAFPVLTRKEADTMARLFMRSVYVEVRRTVERQAADHHAKKK